MVTRKYMIFSWPVSNSYCLLRSRLKCPHNKIIELESMSDVQSVQCTLKIMLSRLSLHRWNCFIAGSSHTRLIFFRFYWELTYKRLHSFLLAYEVKTYNTTHMQQNWLLLWSIKDVHMERNITMTSQLRINQLCRTWCVLKTPHF